MIAHIPPRGSIKIRKWKGIGEFTEKQTNLIEELRKLYDLTGVTTVIHFRETIFSWSLEWEELKKRERVEGAEDQA